MNERYPIILRTSLFLPVRRQCTLLGKTRGYTDSVIVSVGEGISATISEFDFNVSLVRDPRYLQADPRFVCIGPYVIVCSTFEKAGVKTAKAGSQVILGKNIEPEALLVAVDQELYSIDRSGSIIMGVNPEIIPPTTHTQLQCHQNIADGDAAILPVNQNKIQTYKRVQQKPSHVDAPWAKSDTVRAGELHPFTHMSVALFRNKVFLFFVQVIRGEMTEASLCFAQWHGSAGQQIGRALKGECQLSFTSAIEDPKSGVSKWSPVTTAAVLRTSIRLHPHTRISVCAVTPMLIKFVVMSSDGIPSVYDIFFIPGVLAWVPSSCKQYLLNEDKGNKSSAKGFVVAEGWIVNPYSDTALVGDAQSTQLYCAGAAPDERGALLRRLEEDETWLRLNDQKNGRP
ncbi:hypothetical protein MMC29_002650 [Sticta canariensis]|nr:hypothetical protein [Sticta canariensis]